MARITWKLDAYIVKSVNGQCAGLTEKTLFMIIGKTYTICFEIDTIIMVIHGFWGIIGLLDVFFGMFGFVMAIVR